MGQVAAYPRWEEASAKAHAQAIGGTAKFDQHAVSAEWGPTSIGIWYVYDAPTPVPAPGGSQGQSQTAPTPPPASTTPGLTPMMANQPQATGGGQGFARGANQIIMELPQMMGDWQGVETLIPDNRLAANKSPRSFNWDRFARYGSRGVRRGLAKLTDDIETANDSANASASVVPAAKASYVASSDWFQFRLPNGTTAAFWFDTTGADVEPAGSAAATNGGVRIDISALVTAAQVGAAIVSAVNTAAIGVAASGTTTVAFAVTSGGDNWYLEGFVTDPTAFVVTDFSITGGSAINSSYVGFGLMVMPGAISGEDALTLMYRDPASAIGSAPSGLLATSVHLCDVGPRWGRPKRLQGIRGPDLELSRTGSVVHVEATYNVISASQVGLRKQTVKGYTVRYLGPYVGPPRWPYDPDEAAALSTALKQRDTWDGQVRTDDTPALASGRWWFAAWAHTLEGMSEPSLASISIP